ncbi:MAG TPA: efflux RND transporter periplasmic adaptor subunit, partial [Deltaproteobacteria bacterium]|nr:efflux RND transporter periplasmic adaptor subunit [Deltaproteobacteria bacterium]
ALVTASQPSPLVTIQQIDPIYVDIPQSTAELLRLKRRTELGTLDRNGAGRDRVRLNLEDGSAYALEGTLQFQDITVDRMTGSVILRAVFPNPKGVLLPGMFVRAVAVEGVNRRAILIPQHAVSRDPKGNPVALVVNRKGTVEQRQLSIDRAMGNQWLVTSGLVPGDRVIVEGMQKVRPGAQAKAVSTDGVSPMEPAAGKGDTPASPAN